MRVGVLTYHNTANYGAALQAYATQYALTGLGVDAEIIDYTNEYRRGNYSVRKRLLNQVRQARLFQAVKTMAGAYMIVSRTRAFNAFYRANLKMSASVFQTKKSLKENPPDYDVYLVGSDQVWNYRNNGMDFNYLLDFVSDKSKTVSYASSFGVDVIPEELKEKYASSLREIRAISVREKMGADLICQLTGRKPEIVLDPVFLPEKSHWYGLAGENNAFERPYILTYVSNPGYLSEFQKKTGYSPGKKEIVKIGTDLSLGDLYQRHTRVRSTAGPEAFLGYIRDADIVLTSSFHGTAFSILMETPFIAFLSGDKGRDSRVVELLSALGLMDRIFNDRMTGEMVEQEIDYQAVHRRLSVLRKQSVRFLDKALQQISQDLESL